MIGLSVLIVLIVIAVVIVITVLSHKRLTPAQIQMIEKEWKHIETITQPSAKIMEAEKVFHHFLKMSGHEGSLGDILKKIGDAVPNQQAVWDAHKLRNRIAHEPGFVVSDKEAQRAVSAFEKALRGML